MYHTFVNDNNIIAFTTDRQDGFSKEPYDTLNLAYHVGDDPDKVLENHLKLAKELGYDYHNLYFGQQTHSINLVKITAASPQISENTDALYTKDSDKYIGVMTADCLPILGYDATSQVVFAIHAGWLGSARMITYHTLSYLIDKEKLDIANTTIYFGPSICQNKYQVQADVYQQLLATPFDNLQECFIANDDGTYQFDNRLYNVKQLAKLGYNTDNIIKLDECTYRLEDKYFSYRRDGKTGRMMSIIALKKEL